MALAFVALLTVGSSAHASSLSVALGVSDVSVSTNASSGTGWFAQTDLTHDGSAAARSGAIGDYGNSQLHVDFNGPATGSFYWKVSSEGCCDSLSFLIDGVQQSSIRGAAEWASVSFTIATSGPHTLTWIYAKDGSVAYGQDAGWVDELVLVGPAPAGPPGIAGTRVVPGFQGSPASLAVTPSTGILSLDYQWYRGASGDISEPLAGATSAVVFLQPTASISTFWVRVTNTLGSVDSETLTLPPSSSSQPHDLLGMGYTRFGQLGNSLSARLPFELTNPGHVVRLAAGERHSLLLSDDGVLSVQGDNSYGQLGVVSDTLIRYPMDIATDVAQVAAGARHSLFLKTDGSLWAMGDNEAGQLGDGGFSNRTVPVFVASGVTRIAAGASHSLFLKTDGSLWACGSNEHGQLGLGSTLLQRRLPVRIATGVAQIAAGATHTLFVKTDGSLWGAGQNSGGQIYAGQLGDIYAPFRITTGVTQVAAGEAHTVFLKTDGSLWGCGSNQQGQLGLGDESEPVSPRQLATGVARIAAGGAQTFFIKTDATLWAMGSNSSGQLGSGLSDNSRVAVLIASDVVDVATGLQHTLFVKTDGSLWGAGYSYEGALGNADSESRDRPLTIAHDVAQVAAGAGHTLFLTTEGSLWAVGANNWGQLGDSSQTDRSQPVRIASDVVEIAAGASHSLFIKTDGSLWGMGYNGPHQLSDSTLNLSSPVQLDTGVAHVAAGGGHTLFLKRDGSLWGMGSNSVGQLGLGRATSSEYPPRHIADGVLGMAAGASHSLFIKTDGSLWGMGSNNDAQLGSSYAWNGIQTPVQIASDVVRAAAGEAHSVFIKTDASLWAVGRNYHGQLGLSYSSYYDVTLPTKVADGVLAAAAGANHTLFVKADGSLYSCGSNIRGQLGLGYHYTDSNVSAPSLVAGSAFDVAAGAAHSLFLSAPTHRVVFDLGSAGRRDGEGELVQRVVQGAAAAPPLVSTVSGQVFIGWDSSFDSVTGDLIVRATYRQAQTLAFTPPASTTFQTGRANTLALSAIASSGLPVGFSVLSGPAALGADGRTLVFSAPGVALLQAMQPGDATWAPASVTRRLVVNGTGKAQTIAFTPPASRTYGETAITLEATASSNLPVEIELVSGPATLSEDRRTLTLGLPGRIVLRSIQPGGAGYAAAAPVTRTITVKKAVLSVSVENASRFVGRPNPEFVLNYSGFVGPEAGDEDTLLAAVAALDRPPLAATRATLSSPQGDYPITLSGGMDDRYEFRPANPVGVLTVRGFGGSYEALLTDDYGTLLGKLSLAVPKDSLAYTGTLALTYLGRPIAVSSASLLSGTTPLLIQSESGAAFAYWRGIGDNLDGLDLSIDADGRLTGHYSRNGTTVANLVYGHRLQVPQAGQPAPWSGRHTLLIPLGSGSDPSEFRLPCGVGHATVDVARATGRMTLRGKLPDGAPLTATLSPSVIGSYLLWTNPYGSRPQSYFGGVLADDSIELPSYDYSSPILGSLDFGAVSVGGTSGASLSLVSVDTVGAVAVTNIQSAAAISSRVASTPRSTEAETRSIRSTGRVLFWQKAALPESTPIANMDRTYPSGFYQLVVPSILLPWQPPVAGSGEAAATLPQRLGIASGPAETGSFAIGYSGFGSWLGYNFDRLPVAASLSPSAKITAATPNLVSWRILSLDPLTGAFSGSLVLTDPAPPASPSAARATRTVPFSGVLIQDENPDNSVIGAGLFLVPALSGSTFSEQFSAEIRFSRH